MGLNFEIIKASLKSAKLFDYDIYPWDECNFKVTKKDQKLPPLGLTPDAIRTLNVQMMVEIDGNELLPGSVEWVSDGTIVSFRNEHVEIGGSHSMSIINLSEPNSIREIGIAIKDSLEYSEKFFQQALDE